MRPKFRFTLSYSTGGGGATFVISEPIGWNQIALNLERDPDYHSLIENIETPLEFYSGRTGHSGGYDALKQIRDNGIDTRVQFLAEVTFDETTYETVMDGLLDLTTLIEIEHKAKFQCAILRNDLWAKFINRKSIPVDIRSTTDLDGGAKTEVTSQTQNLPYQELRLTYSASQVGSLTWALTSGSDPYGIIDFNTITLSEIQTKYNYTPLVSPTRPFELFAVELDGDYTISSEIHLSTGSGPTAGVNAGVNVYVQINDNAAIAFSRSDLGSPNVRTRFTYSGTHSLVRGQFIRIYILTSFTQTVAWETGFDNFLLVEADTAFTDSTVPAFYVHDVAMGIAERIIGDTTPFYSDYLGGTPSFKIDYPTNGCGMDYMLFKGVHIRGYRLDVKAFSQSFDEWWDGMNKIFNLGLGYETVTFKLAGGASLTKEVIRVEPKEDFYDDSDYSVQLNYVTEIEISYDADYIFTSVEIGYVKWQDEAASGIDDPQTKHTYATIFKTIGTKEKKDIQILSPFVAASLVIEQGRRKSLEAGRDWDFDEDVFILHTNINSSPGAPRLYSSAAITGLLNADTRYNVRLTPACNLARWKNYLANAFQNNTTDVFRFTGGEGNVDMTFNNPAAAGCDLEAGASSDENANVTIGTDFLFLPLLYKFKHNLTWTQYKAIRDNKKKSIRIIWNRNDGSVMTSILFIKKLSYKINKSQGEFECWLKTQYAV